MESNKKILLAGATGYLGSFILEELKLRGLPVKVLVRDPKRLKQKNIEAGEVFNAEITNPESIKGCCEDFDTVISTVGITRQKDGLTYMDVDYQANKNILDEAKRSGVKKFIYVSVLNGTMLRALKICEAKEKFVDELKLSGLEYCIIRPSGFYSDILEIFNMANKGKVFLFGNGSIKMNPIHGEDLAKKIVESIELTEKELNIGGPQTFTQNEMANIAFKVLNKKTKITYIPDWVRKFILSFIKIFLSQKIYGPIEFVLTILSVDMTAPEYGMHKLEDFYKESIRIK